MRGLRALFDVNFLIALLQPDHMHHRQAHAWWDANQEHGWATCPLTENGFARIVSQPSYGHPMPVAAALRYIAEQAEATNHAFWSDDISLLDDVRFDWNRMLGPKQLTDIYLLGLAVAHDGRLATFDRSVSLLPARGAEPRHLVVL